MNNNLNSFTLHHLTVSKEIGLYHCSVNTLKKYIIILYLKISIFKSQMKDLNLSKKINNFRLLTHTTLHAS